MKKNNQSSLKRGGKGNSDKQPGASDSWIMEHNTVVSSWLALTGHMTNDMLITARWLAVRGQVTQYSTVSGQVIRLRANEG